MFRGLPETPEESVSNLKEKPEKRKLRTDNFILLKRDLDDGCPGGGSVVRLYRTYRVPSSSPVH